MNKPSDPIERNNAARIADALERIAAALEKLAEAGTGSVRVKTESDDDPVIIASDVATPKDIADENHTAENGDIDSGNDIPDENKITSEDYRIEDEGISSDEAQISSQYDADDDNQEESPEEKRRHPRKPCSIVVDYASRDRAFRDYIRDISSGGVFIETSKEFSIGDEIMMTFSISSKQKPFKFTGQVVRITKKGIGVKFKKNLRSERSP